MSLYHLVHHTGMVLPFVLKVPATKGFLHLVVSVKTYLAIRPAKSASLATKVIISVARVSRALNSESFFGGTELALKPPSSNNNHLIAYQIISIESVLQLPAPPFSPCRQALQQVAQLYLHQHRCEGHLHAAPPGNKIGVVRWETSQDCLIFKVESVSESA